MSVDSPSERVEVPLLYAHIADAREHAESERAREHLREAAEYVITLEKQ
ncbi:hypothetical protein [Salinibaculum rarum]|nr:hypothetical protein [Salinibaculum sp. KK48]